MIKLSCPWRICAYLSHRVPNARHQKWRVGLTLIIALSWFADGHNYTRRSLRDRILMGMFAVNVMYSVGLVIPISLVYTSNDARCGMRVITSGTSFAGGFGLFLGGKCAMVLYEGFIVGASLLSLKTGRTELPRWVEIMAHATCVAVGVGMFVGWTAHWGPLMTVDDAKEEAAYFQAAKDANVSLMAIMRIWVAVLAVVVGLWGWSRLVLRQLEREWDDALVDVNHQWDRDREDTAGFAPVGPALPPLHSGMSNRVISRHLSLRAVLPCRLLRDPYACPVRPDPACYTCSQSGKRAIRKSPRRGCRSAGCST